MKLWRYHNLITTLSSALATLTLPRPFHLAENKPVPLEVDTVDVDFDENTAQQLIKNLNLARDMLVSAFPTLDKEASW